MLVPLHGFLKGDTLGIVILVQDSDPIRRVAACLQEAACMRVVPTALAAVYFEGRCLDPNATVAQSGLTALDRIEVIPERAA